MQIELRPIESLKPYPQNPRRHGRAVEAVAGSLKSFGWRQPIVVDRDGVVVAGHARLAAAHRLGMTEVPVHVAHDLTPAQIASYRLADNRVAEIAEWDPELLAEELKALGALDVDLTLLGFDDAELAELLAPPGSALDGTDDAVEPAKVAVSRTGDLWTLGEHRLLCGDSTKAEDVLRVMDGRKAALVATDPPYLIDYCPRARSRSCRGRSWSTYDARGASGPARTTGATTPRTLRKTRRRWWAQSPRWRTG